MSNPILASGSADFVDLLKEGKFTLENILIALGILIGCLLLNRLAARIMERVAQRDKVDRRLATYIARGVKFILWFIAILLIADNFGIQISSLLALLAVGGLAISLALQDTLKNVAGGINILTAKPFTINDFIEVAGVSGTVLAISLTRTSLRSIDNKIISITNGEIGSSKITNYSGAANRRLELKYIAPYEYDSELVKQIIKDTVRSYPLLLPMGEYGQPNIFVGVNVFQDNGVEYLLRLWVKNSDYWPAYFDLQELVFAALRKNGVGIPYNKLDINLPAGLRKYD